MIPKNLVLAILPILTTATVSFCCGQDVTKDARYNAVIWTQNAAEYQMAARQSYRLAAMQLKKGLADDTWTADEVQRDQGGFANKPPAVILDLDETVLDNSAFNARGIVDGESFSGSAWNAWANEEKAKAVPGALEFIEYAVNEEVAVFYITNRTDDIKAATIDNLVALGFPADANTVLSRNDGDGRGRDKVSRRAMVAEEYRIVLLVGDNMGDFCSGMDQGPTSDRNALAAEKEGILGDRWILLPNPMYGGWEGVLGDRRAALRTEREDAPALLRIRSFNIEHLGSPSSRFGSANGVAQDPDDLADKILETQSDVLALQEIYITAPDHRNATLNETMTKLNQHPGQDWTYVLFRNRSTSDTSQVTGIAWNRDRATRLGGDFRIPIDDGTPDYFEWDRHPHAVKFSAGEGKTDVVVIPLHMKAGSGADEREQRENEAGMLIAALDDVRDHFEDTDLVILGDTNIRGLQEQTAERFQAAGFRDLLPADQTTVMFGVRPFDRAFVASDSLECQNSTQTTCDVAEDEREEYRRRFSDHYPIVITVQVMEDDD